MLGAWCYMTSNNVTTKCK